MAKNVDGEKRIGRPRKNASAVIAQVAFRGVAVRLLTTTHTLYSGTPGSMAQYHGTKQAFRRLRLLSVHLVDSTGLTNRFYDTECWRCKAFVIGLCWCIA